MNPETDEQIGREPHQFPANEQEQQTVRDNHAEHRRGEEGEVGEETRKVLVPRHVAFAENENPKPDKRDHDEHRGGERIEDNAETQNLIAESEPREILNGARPRRLQSRAERG